MEKLSKGILKGKRVLDLSRILVGPLCSMQLSDLGAEVIKIESFEGDQTRYWGQSLSENHKGMSSYFLAMNRNKKSICINLKSAQGQQIILSNLDDITKKSDIFLENFQPGVTKKLNVDFSKISKVNEKIIYASMTGYGKDGPEHQQSAFDLVMQAKTGYMDITGDSEGQPTKFGFAITDVLTGLYTTQAILAAIIAQQTEKGPIHINNSLLESALSAQSNISSLYLNENKIPKRKGNDHNSIVPYGSYQGKDAVIVLGVGTDLQFQKLCQILGIDEIGLDDKYKTNNDRLKNRDSLRIILENALQKFPAKSIVKQMEINKIPGSLVRSIEEVYNSDQVKHLQIVKELQSDIVPKQKQVRCPYTFNNDKFLADIKEPPFLNEHKYYILKEILQKNDQEIQELLNDKVIL